MRIIAGKYKSRKINSLPERKSGKLNSFRPTLDRSRETLFNVLTNLYDFENAECLDLFAGTGSLGFESLSRGASKCTFIDLSSDAADIIQKTAEELKCDSDIIIERTKAESFIKENAGKEFNIIFADPPYDYNDYDYLIKMISEIKFDIFVLESDNPVNAKIQDKKLRQVKSGRTIFNIFY